MNTSEKSVVPHSMSSHPPSTSNFQELMSIPLVSAYDREYWSSPSTGYISTYDMYSIKYPAISYDSNTHHRPLSSTTTVMSAVKNNITQRKKNANKHPHIKRPGNSFMIWSCYRRQEITLANPNWHQSEISKQLGAEWKLLTMGEKKPFIDEANRRIEQHKIDNPDYKYRPRRKRKSVKNTFEPSVVTHSPSSYFSTNFDYPDYKFRVRRKTKCVMNTHEPSVVSHRMCSCSPPNFDEQEFMSNLRVSAYDRENWSNHPTGYNPTYDMYSITDPAISYASNTQCADSWTSTTAHNAQSQAVPPYQYTFKHSEQNAYERVYNLRNSVLRNTSSQPLNHYISPEPLQQTGQSFAYNLDQ